LYFIYWPLTDGIVSKVKPLGEEMTMRKKASSVIADIRELMAEHGLTTADIEAYTGKAKAGAKRGPKPGFKRGGKSAAAAPAKKAALQTKGKLPPKYRDPKTGATWSGHARPPQWIANVKDRSRFLIDGVGAVVSDSGTVRGPKAAAKSVGKSAAKGKLPPKYINHKTCETWSGHARPPAWIKDVKDRSKLLIDGAGAAADAGVSTKTKLAAKKAVVKNSQRQKQHRRRRRR
jgi:DNA-binding protein H-NS